MPHQLFVLVRRPLDAPAIDGAVQPQFHQTQPAGINREGDAGGNDTQRQSRHEAPRDDRQKDHGHLDVIGALHGTPALHQPVKEQIRSELEQHGAEDGHGHVSQHLCAERQGEQADCARKNPAGAVPRAGTIVKQRSAHRERSGHSPAHSHQNVGHSIQAQFAIKIHIEARLHFDGHQAQQ